MIYFTHYWFIFMTILVRIRSKTALYNWNVVCGKQSKYSNFGTLLDNKRRSWLDNTSVCRYVRHAHVYVESRNGRPGSAPAGMSLLLSSPSSLFGSYSTFRGLDLFVGVVELLRYFTDLRLFRFNTLRSMDNPRNGLGKFFITTCF